MKVLGKLPSPTLPQKEEEFKIKISHLESKNVFESKDFRSRSFQ